MRFACGEVSQAQLEGRAWLPWGYLGSSLLELEPGNRNGESSRKVLGIQQPESRWYRGQHSPCCHRGTGSVPIHSPEVQGFSTLHPKGSVTHGPGRAPTFLRSPVLWGWAGNWTLGLSGQCSRVLGNCAVGLWFCQGLSMNTGPGGGTVTRTRQEVGTHQAPPQDAPA